MKSKAQRQKQLQRKQLSRDADLRAVLATPTGRRFIWRIITSVCHVFGDSFHADSRVEARSLGQQSVGQALMRECQRVSPKTYLLMVQEQTNQDLLELAAAKGSDDNTSTA